MSWTPEKEYCKNKCEQQNEVLSWPTNEITDVSWLVVMGVYTSVLTSCQNNHLEPHTALKVVVHKLEMGLRMYISKKYPSLEMVHLQVGNPPGSEPNFLASFQVATLEVSHLHIVLHTPAVSYSFCLETSCAISH